MRGKGIGLLSLLMALALLAGCGSSAVQQTQVQEETPLFVEVVSMDTVALADEAAALAEAPEAAVSPLLLAEASGTMVKENAKAIIDYSHTDDGYVMVKFTAATDKRLKVKVTGPTTSYTYNIQQGEWTVFSLSDGSGSYQVKVYQNTTGNRYSVALSQSMEVTLKDEFAPFLRPNQYVNYSAESKIVAKADELAGKLSDPLEKVAAIYDYVIHSMSYDKAKAASVQSGYLPDLDAVYASKKGICFDYAALMTGMLRSQGVPCKLVVGYAGSAYHAWISVWSEKTGWVDNAVYFDGSAWQRMDPTFASTGKQSAAIMKYIGDGKNYTAKYLY